MPRFSDANRWSIPATTLSRSTSSGSQTMSSAGRETLKAIPTSTSSVATAAAMVGAMTAIAKHTCLDHLPAVASWLRHADAAKVVNEAHTHDTPEAKVSAMVYANVVAQLTNIRTHPTVALALGQGKVSLHGWVYDIETGHINALDGKRDIFVNLTTHPDTVAFESCKLQKAA